MYLLKLNYGYQISSIFIGSPDTGYQFIYLLYLIWSRNAEAKKRAENIFAALRKNGRQKPFWIGIDRARNQHGRVLDPGVFNKTIILLGLARYKMIMTSLHIQRALVE